MGKDLFSDAPAAYAAHRPRYPEALFAWLAEQAPARGQAWDAGTGSGQAALGLAQHVQAVLATDISSEQLAHAFPHPNITYKVHAAERNPLPDRSVHLITAAQAVHWFDEGAFYATVARVAVPGALLALFGYYLGVITPGVDRLVLQLEHELLANYWAPEREHVRTHYAELDVPFTELEAPPFFIELSWRFEDLLAYLRTWSAIKTYEKERGYAFP